LENLVSVIIVTYNVEKYLMFALDSALSQANIKTELIIADDGSTDSTPKIISEYCRRGNVKALFMEHTGNVGKMRNEAIKLSNGSIIAFLDGDDVWCNDKLLKQLSFLNHYEMVCSNAVEVNSSGEILNPEYFKNEPTGDLDLNQLVYKNYVFTSSVVLNKRILSSSGLFEEEIGIRGEDYLLWLNIAKLCNIKYIPDTLIQYRRHVNNLSFMNVPERKRLLERTISIRKQFWEYNDPEVAQMAKAGSADLYSELCKISYKSGNYQEAVDFCKSFINLYKNKFSCRYFKYIFFLVLLFLKKIKGELLKI
jgi:glycosyltransferase involved in cell wall biosynthesis